MRILLAIVLAFCPVAAFAEWKEAKTNHFLIYGNKSDSELTRFAERLEAVHYLMLRAIGLQDDKSPVRVKIYIYGTPALVERLSTQKNAVGFYRPGPGGSIAVIPSDSKGIGLDPTEVLYHEYGHHFMLQYTPIAYPAWYVEGWAELFATSSFERKGAITFGKANSDRAGELDYGTWTHVGDIVSKPRSELPKTSREAFYGQSWLLAHYLTLSSARSQQLKAYLLDINRGKSQAEAAKAFGDLDQFNRDVRAYLSRRSFEYKALPLPETLVSNIALRTLSPSEVALMEEQIEFRRRMPEEEAKAFLAKLRTKAGRFGEDPAALLLLGEAELDMENYESTRAIADRLVKVAPDNARALWLKGKVELKLAEDADDVSVAVKGAREWLVKANAADPSDPLPFVAMFDSYAVEGKRPGKSAVDGLAEAQRLVPQDDSVRFKLAGALANRNDPVALVEAIRLLRPMAFDPHGGKGAEAAQDMIDMLSGNASPAVEAAPAS